MRVILLLICSLFISSCFSQECLSACDAGLSTCSALNYNLFVTNITETLQREAKVKQYVLELRSADFSVCADYMQIVMCNAMHPSCDGTNPTPRRACNQLCVGLKTYCPSPLPIFMPAEIQYFFMCDNSPLYAPVNNTQCSLSVNTVSPCPKNETTLQYTGVCQPYNFGGLLNLSSAGICAPFVSKMVYMPIGWTTVQVMANYLFVAQDYQLRFPKSFPIMPVDCYTSLSALICGSYFQSCTYIDVPEFGVKAAVGQYPCESLCDRTIDKCWDFFVSANLTYLLQDCKTAYPTPDPYIVPVGNSYALSTCRDFVFPEDPYQSDFTPPVLEKCPTAFGLKSEYTDSESRCGLACPDSSYTAKEWRALVQVIRAGASLSLILMSFLIISYLVQFEKRKFPSAIHFWQFVATSGFAISFLINGTNPEKDVWCKDPGTSATQGNNSACAAQGFLFIFFGLALSAWCMVIAIIIFYGIVQNKKVDNLAKFAKFFHLFAWGLPLVFAIAAIASNSIGYGPPLAWCFIHFEGFGYNEGKFSRDYPLFYIPMLAMFVVVLALFIATVTKIIRVRRTKVAGKKSGGSRTFQAQVLVICFSIFEWRFEIEGKKSTEEVGLNWAYCKLQIALEVPVNEGACSGDTNPARIEYSRTVGESFVLSGIGLLIFVAFGADIGIYKHWMKIFRLGFAKEWQQVKDLIYFGKDPFSSSSSGKTKSNNSISNSKDSKNSKNSKNDKNNLTGSFNNSSNDRGNTSTGDETSSNDIELNTTDEARKNLLKLRKFT